MKLLFQKIERKLHQCRLKPIRVFCVHQVSERFDNSTMSHGDWMQIEVFKRAIESLLRDGYRFISLPEMQEKLKHDILRVQKYAVLTADDGWGSIKNILPWLAERQIPITLFLNPAYLDGKHFRERKTEKYLTEEEVCHLYERYPLLTIGMHGWEHADAAKQSLSEFKESVMCSVKYLSRINNYIPYFAYAWGNHTIDTDTILLDMHISPVLMDGGKNYNETKYIHRELL